MKVTVTPLERPSRTKRQSLHYHICIQVDVCPNTSQHWCRVGRTNNTFGGTLSYVLPLFSTLGYGWACR